MLTHYISAALRQFRRYKVTTSINIACLTLGLICFIVAWGTTAYTAKTDNYHENASRTYALFTSRISPNSQLTTATNTWLLAEYLRADFPQLQASARASVARETPIVLEGKNQFAYVAFADPQFLTVFDLPLIAGNFRTALDTPRSAIVTEALAKRLFGTDRVVGRTFRLGGGQELITITGVVGAIARPSHLSTTGAVTPFGVRFDVLVSMDMNPAKNTTQSWNNNIYYTYVVLPRDGSLTIASFNSQLRAFAKRNVPTDQTGDLQFRAHPVADITEVSLNSIVGADKTGVSSTAILIVLGGIVLLVACLNYANLATAQATTRMKEIALRRVVGASRYQIATQHLIEGFLLTGTALLVSLLFIAAILLSIGAATFILFLKLFAPMPQFWGFLGASIVLVALASSAIPALALSRVRPAIALRGVRASSGSRFVSTLLAGLQFGFAGFLLVSVFVMAAQNKAMQQAVWDPQSDPIVVIANDLRNAGVDARLLKEELLRQPGIVAAGGLEFMPWSTNFGFAELANSANSSKRIRASRQMVDADIFKTLDIKLLAGRPFDMQRAADVANAAAFRQGEASGAIDYNVIIDLAMVPKMGFESPQQAIGKTIYRPTSQSGSTPPQRLHVIGVVENSLVQPMNFGAPMLYLLNPDAAGVTIVRISKRNVAAALAGIDKVWSTLAPELPIKRRFADEQYESAYGFLKIVDKVFAVLAILATIIALMGLIAMALHVIRRRTQEIGVRKTLGASVGQILWLLLRSFSRPIIIANLAVWPLVFLAMRGYLSLFAVRSGLTWAPFVLSLLITLAVAWLAVVTQATRAARMNPATVLRYE